MGAISEKAQESEGTYVSIIGHSRTGKTTRATCLSEQLDPTGRELRPCYRVTSLGQTRNICLGVKSLTNVSRLGSIVLTYLDYPGQDHVSAYYILQGMAELVRQLKELDQGWGLEVLGNLRARATEVAEVFLRPNVRLEEALETIESVIRDPFKPFRIKGGGGLAIDDIIARTMASASLISLMEPGERGMDSDKAMADGAVIKNIEEKLPENLKRLRKYAGCSSEQGSRLDIINVINWLLCEMEAPEEVCRKNGKYRGAVESFDIPRDKYSLENLPHRFRITGPLIAYLVLGLLWKSRVIIFATPINKEAWYEKLYKTYEYIPQGTGGLGETVFLALVKQCLDRNLIGDGEFVKACTEALLGGMNTYDEVKETKTINKCLRLASLIRAGRLGDAKDYLEKELSKEDIKKLLSFAIGESMRTFHFGFIDLSLLLLEEFSKSRSEGKMEQSRKDVFFLLTYHEGLEYPKSLDRLKGDVVPTYFDNFRKTLRRVRQSLKAELDVYMVPSTIYRVGGGSGDGEEAALSICTGVEAALIHCVLGGSQTKTIKICKERLNRMDKGECKDFRCVDLETAFKYDTWSYLIG